MVTMSMRLSDDVSGRFADMGLNVIFVELYILYTRIHQYTERIKNVEAYIPILSGDFSV